MRFFRIPSFTGIETHRDDADRGSLRAVEGCLPHGPGGVRSGPVWEEVANITQFSNNSHNELTGFDDPYGNSILVASRAGEVHDIQVISKENTPVGSFDTEYPVLESLVHDQRPAPITPIGNRMYSFGDGSAEAVFFGQGPAGENHYVYPDGELYSLEHSRFPSCRFFVQGPNKALFGAGNPDKPLTVYVSEPAGLSQPVRDNPYSTELTADFEGRLSTVDILGSNASQITALSTRGNQVVVHTDKGCHLLYAPTGDQAGTGYRVEQASATSFSAAVNVQVVAGESGSQNFWLGHDGQIYKDEAAARGAEDKKNFTDGSQASWKSKGVWEKELQDDLSKSFATYDPQSGMYWVFTETPDFYDFMSGEPPEAPLGLKISGIIPETPGTPGFLTITGTAPDIPNSPRNLDLVAEPDAPSVPQNLALTVTPDIPNSPDNLTITAAIPDAPNSVTGLSIPIPVFGPGSLEGVQSVPDAGPTNLEGSLPNPSAGPLNLTGNVSVPVEGPSNLESTQFLPSAGPENLSGTTQTPSNGPSNLSVILPAVGPSGLSGSVALPVSGPTELSGAVVIPASGPTNLIAEGPPTGGPTNLIAESSVPASGPSSLTGSVETPAGGPSSLQGDVELPVSGPTNTTAREVFIIDIQVSSLNDLPVSPVTGTIVYVKASDTAVPMLYNATTSTWYHYGQAAANPVPDSTHPF